MAVYGNKVIVNIFELMSTGFEACDYISNRLNNNISDYTIKLLNDLNSMINGILEVVNTFKLKENFIENLIFNINDYIFKIIGHINLGNIKKAQIDFDFVLYGLYFRLNKELYINLIVLQDDEAFRKYYDEEFSLLDEIRNTNGEVLKEISNNEYKYKVSILVPVYNNKEYTKKCIESIYKYTEGIGTKYELIIRSDGSTDGVNEYLETLPIEKKLIYNYNVRLGSELGYAVEGEYVVNVSNDVVVTHNWLDNLIKCIESDDKIGMVVPTTNSLSNYQTIPVNYKTEEEMQEFAKNYNISDSSKWEERERLINFVAIVRTKVSMALDGEDLAMTYGHFADDDICLRYRRAGYKLINAKDTFVHHYGSASYSAIAGNTMALMENHIVKKHGFSTWGENLANINIQDFIYYNNSFGKEFNILCIDDSLGSVGLFIKNKLKANGAKKINLYGAIQSEKYLPYVEATYKKCELFNNIINITTVKMDYIIIPNLCDLGSNYMDILLNVKKLLNDSGKIYFTINNMMCFGNIIASFNGLNFMLPNADSRNSSPRLCFFNADKLANEIKNREFKIETIHSLKVECDKNILDYLANFAGNIQGVDKNYFENNIDIKNYIFEIQ